MRESKFKDLDVRQALEQTCGNVTHAAAILEISKMQALRLTKKYELVSFAAELRASVGCPATGRPKKSLGMPTNGNIFVDV